MYLIYSKHIAVIENKTTTKKWNKKLEIIQIFSTCAANAFAEHVAAFIVVFRQVFFDKLVHVCVDYCTVIAELQLQRQSRYVTHTPRPVRSISFVYVHAVSIKI